MFSIAVSSSISASSFITATGNVIGGNINTVGAVVATGNVNTLANVNGANLGASGLITAVGNISGGNLSGTSILGTLTTAAQNNITSVGTLGSLAVTANIAGGNLTTAGQVSATGNVSANFYIGNGSALTGVLATGIGTLASLSVTGNTATITTANYSVGYLNIPQISFAANATAALVDSGKHYYSTSASNLALTLADNSAVSWPVGTALSVINRGTANVTVAPAAGVSLYLAGNSTSANRTVTTYGMATVMNVAANIWMINGTVV